MSETPTAVEALPVMQQNQRGGPRYVQVRAQHPRPSVTCSACHRRLDQDELHVYDCTRRWGQLPRRWCAPCWQADPQPQVIR